VPRRLRRIKGGANSLLIKHAFIHKWRVEFMGLMADIKRIQQQVREVVDPVAAAKHRALARFEDGVKVRKMFERAAAHHLRSFLKRRWAGALERKRAMQAKVDGYKRLSDEYKAKARLWRQLQEIMRRAQARARAASAFRMQAPRRAWNKCARAATKPGAASLPHPPRAARASHSRGAACARRTHRARRCLFWWQMGGVLHAASRGATDAGVGRHPDR
jgi:hypothetical protein